MNHSLSVFLINNHARAVMVRYEPDRGGDKDVLFKTLDETIKVDDLVVIPTGTRYRFTVAKVTAVDVDVDYSSPTKAEWILGRVDTGEYDQLVADENKAIAKLKAIEAKQMRNKLMADLLAIDGEGIKSLELYDANGDKPAA